MHDGCNGQFENGAMVVNKVRQMGYNTLPLPAPLEIQCTSCENDFTMKTMEDRCDSCGMVYGVTPCHASDAANVQPAGIDY